MKKFLIILIIFIGLVGCSEEEQAKYNDSKAFVSFQSNVYDLKIPLDSSKDLPLVLESSNIVDYDRTYQVSIVDSETDANPATYSLPSTVTIPGGSYTGNLIISGTDGGLVDANVKKLTLTISGFQSNESFDTDKLVINIVEFCPVILDEFLGGFSSETWWNGPNVNEVIAGAEPNTLEITDFFTDDSVNPNLKFTYDPDNNNAINFVERPTGFVGAQGPIWARISSSPSNVSSVDACTGRIGIWINYFIPDVGSYGDKNEVFVKL